MIGTLLAGVVAGYGVALPLGAIGTYLIGLGTRRSGNRRRRVGVASTDDLRGAGTWGVAWPLLRPVPSVELPAAPSWVWRRLGRR